MAVKHFFIVKDGAIVNKIVIEGDELLASTDAPHGCDIGWTRKGKTFVAPPPLETDEESGE